MGLELLRLQVRLELSEPESHARSTAKPVLEELESARLEPPEPELAHQVEWAWLRQQFQEA